jgi:hypothetical protein
MMRNIIIILAGLLALAAAAFWMLSRNDYVFRFSEEDLRGHLDARLPYEGRHLFVFDVTLDNPRIDLVEGSDRVAGGVDVMLKVDLAGRELALSGAADISSGVRYDAEERAFYMTDPAVEALRIPGVPESYANRANSAISSALGEFYRTQPIYVLEADTAAKSAARLLLKDVAVKDEHLVVTMGLKETAPGGAD